MLPAGVATITPSQISSSTRTTPSTLILILAAWRVSRSIETSLMASASRVSPWIVSARMLSGCRTVLCACSSRAGRSSRENSFIKKPTVPRLMP